ncbi:hypothetical protein COO92_12005 [Thalassospira lohafexi]|uniref:Uncharacterized protein n=1 Tax=Thalassospira lohafexi TaxID=744227 RepID=A0A2N3L6Q2_9PROT|nr:hypothetical protein COO92_12005 [Thalassospira lohafexi]
MIIPDTPNDTINRARTANFTSYKQKYSKKPHEFYARLVSTGSTAVSDPTKCIDPSFWRQARTLFSEDAVSIALFVDIAGPDGSTLVKRLPLFSRAEKEKGNDRCRVYISSSRLTPLYNMPPDAVFSLKFYLEYSKATDFKLTETVGKTIGVLSTAFTGPGFLAVAETANQVASQVEKIESELDDAGATLTAGLDVDETLSILGDPTHDAIVFSLRGISSDWGGIELSDQIETYVQISLDIRESVFRENGGAFPKTPTKYLNVDMPRHEHTTINDLATVEDGTGPKASNFELLDPGQQSHIDRYAGLCRSLRQYLSNNYGLNSSDELLARAAFLRSYGRYWREQAFRSDDCLSEVEQQRLKTLVGWELPAGIEQLNRDAVIVRFSNIIASILKSPGGIRKKRLADLTAGSGFYVVPASSAEFGLDVDADYFEEVDALDWIGSIPRMRNTVCYQATKSQLISIAMVVRVANQKPVALGIEFEKPVAFPDGFDGTDVNAVEAIVKGIKIQSLTFDSFENIRNLVVAPENWPTSSTSSDCQSVISAAVASNG